METKLSNTEIKILELLKKRYFENDFEVELSILNLPLIESNKGLKVKEAAFYIERLIHRGYVYFEGDDFMKNDMSDNKYKSHISLIWFGNLRIYDAGLQYIEEYNLTKVDKIKRSIKKFKSDLGKDLRSKIISHLATFIFGVIATILYYSII